MRIYASNNFWNTCSNLSNIYNPRLILSTQQNRSQSVPEGLSTLTEQCYCKPNTTREIIYLPKDELIDAEHLPIYPNTESVAMRIRTPAKEADEFMTSTVMSTIPRYYKHKRSHSLSRCANVQFVEQMTTSV